VIPLHIRWAPFARKTASIVAVTHFLPCKGGGSSGEVELVFDVRLPAVPLAAARALRLTCSLCAERSVPRFNRPTSRPLSFSAKPLAFAPLGRNVWDTLPGYVPTHSRSKVAQHRAPEHGPGKRCRNFRSSAITIVEALDEWFQPFHIAVAAPRVLRPLGARSSPSSKQGRVSTRRTIWFGLRPGACRANAIAPGKTSPGPDWIEMPPSRLQLGCRWRMAQFAACRLKARRSVFWSALLWQSFGMIKA